MPIFKTKAVDLKITLRLNNMKVFRKIIVPLNITFSNLHKIIQTAFGWQDYHLHEFYIFESKNSGQPYSPNHPAYEGEGKTPPKDVAGAPGYEEFLEILTDKNHPEHKHIQTWSKGKIYKDFDIEMVNRLLKYS